MTDSRNVLVDLLAHLRMALGQLRLYPVGSPQALKSIAVSHASLTASLATHGKLTLSRTLRGLLLNGKRLPAAGEAAATIEKSWLQILQDAQVNSITFRQPIGIEELAIFLGALGKKFWDLKEGKAINQRLRESRVSQAWVEEVQFVAVGAGDLVLEGAAAKLEAAGARVAEIVSTLEQVIDGTASEGLTEQVRLEIMRKLLDHDPSLIQKARAAGYVASASDAKSASGGGPGWISFEQARKSLSDIARLLQSADPDQREALREIGHRIIGGFRYDPLLAALLKKFLTDEAIDLIPAWMNESEKKSDTNVPVPIRRAGEILALGEEPRADALLEESASLAKELIELERTDLVGEFVKSLVDQARQVSTDRRRKAVQTLIQYLPLLDIAPLNEARVQIEARVLSALSLERDGMTFNWLCDAAASIIEGLLTRGELDRALPFLDALSKQAQTSDAESPELSDVAFRALERVAAGRGFPTLLERFGERDPLAIRAAEALASGGARLFIEQLKIADSAASRLLIAQVLLKAGPRAGNALAEETQKVFAPSEALRLVEAIPSAMADAQAESALGALLRHPALAVRRRAASLLASRAYPQAGSFVLQALRDETDPSARALLVDALRQLRYEDAIATLGQMIEARSENDEVRAAACAALGALGKPQAIPMLTRACTKGDRGITKFILSIGPVVRAAAARALAGYAHYSESREALRRALDDREPAVREAAQEALAAPLAKAFGDDLRRVRLINTVGPQSFESACAGYLAEVALDLLLQSLEEQRKSGAILLSVGGLVARIHLDRGGVVAADYDGWQDQEAFNHFCRREGAFFYYNPATAAPRHGPPQSPIRLLMNACELQGRAEWPASQG